MRPQARKAKADGFPVPAADRTHVPVETKDFLSVLDLTHDELDRILDLAAEMKRDRTEGRPSMQPLAGKHIGLIFEKPSLRTRTTFTIVIMATSSTDLTQSTILPVPIFTPRTCRSTSHP